MRRVKVTIEMIGFNANGKITLETNQIEMDVHCHELADIQLRAIKHCAQDLKSSNDAIDDFYRDFHK